MMFFKNKKADNTVAPAAGRYGTVGMLRLAFTSWLLVGLLMFIAAAALDHLQSEGVAQERERNAEGIAVAVATEVADLFFERSQVVAGLAAQPHVVAALRVGNPQRLATLEQELGKVLGPAARVHLLGPSLKPTRDRNVAGWWGFATADIAARAQSGEKTPAEVHAYGADNKRLVIAAPVPDSRGVLVAMWTLDSLRSAIVPAARAGVPVLLHQRDGLELFRTDDIGGVYRALPVGGSLLEVRYSAKPERAAGLRPWLGWMIWAMLFGLSGVVIWLKVGSLRKRLKGDQQTFADLTSDAFRGRVHHDYPIGLSESVDVFGRIHTEAREFVASANRSRRQRQATAQASQKNLSAALEAASHDKQARQPGSADYALPDILFQGHDVRGVVDEYLTEDSAYWMGQSVASEAYERGQDTIIVGRDSRESSPLLAAALAKGVIATGRKVLDIGMVPAPLWYFSALRDGPGTGVYVTGGHCPVEYAGFKMLLRGEPVLTETLTALRQRAIQGNLLKGEGAINNKDWSAEYLESIADDIQLSRPLRVIVDVGNGAAGSLAKALFKRLGCEVKVLNEPVDPNFSGRGPAIHSLHALVGLRKAVGKTRADIGFALDGDGDALVAVDKLGNVQWPDQLATLLSYEVLAGQPGTDVLHDLRCSRYLAAEIVANGGRPVSCAAGYTTMHEQMRKSGAALGAEFSGHIFLADRWNGTPDAFYAAARVCEILAADSRPSNEIFAELPTTANSPEYRIVLDTGLAESVMAQMQAEKHLSDAQLSQRDGLRADFPRGWGVLRLMRTQPGLSMRFEADTDEELATIQTQFKKLILDVRSDIPLPF